jgi:hypothetical protein
MRFSRFRSAVAAVAVSAAVLALAACGAGDDLGQPGAPAAPGQVATSADCLASGLRYFSDLGMPEPDAEEHAAAPEPGTVPAGFEAAQAVLCTGEFGAEIDGEQWQAVRETRYDGDLAPLLKALDEPSDARSTGPCTADYEIVPELWVVAENGEAVRAAWPTDGCGKTKPAVRTALSTLEVVDENLLPVARIEMVDPSSSSCLSQLPPDGGVIAEPFDPDEIEPGVVRPDSTVPSAAPGAASDLVC